MRRAQCGFTLLEVMLAIVILSTLSFLAASVFSQTMEEYQRAQNLTQKFNALQRTDLLLGNDLMQLVPRINRQTNQVFQSETEGMIFSTQSLGIDAATRPQSRLITVHWYLQDGVLFRAVRTASDSKEERAPRPMLEGVTHFTARIQNSEDGSIPAQARVILEFKSSEQVRRDYVLPDWFPTRQQASETAGAAK
ncbi:prepilin-type N-terminal cleavage/methylation domain-containing protein [Citrobacter sp. wls830]|nr:prepilin-type N-terminal cleavage/methylation domain-containing protein [Citrobacter sp. wls830]